MFSGIFVKDIIEAVPIDKAFELFKPGDTDASLGGYIRVTLRTGPNVPSVPRIEEDPVAIMQGKTRNLQKTIFRMNADEDQVQEQAEGEESGKNRNLFRVLLLAGLAATITIIRIKTHKKRT